MKKYLEKNVYEALQDRLKFIFDNFDNIYVSFSGGKDSGLLLNMVLSYKRRNKIAKKIGVFHQDFEAQYQTTTDFVSRMFENNLRDIEPYWVCLPMGSRCAVSNYQMYWYPWDPDKKELWVRPMPKMPYIINMDNNPFDFYRYKMVQEDLYAEFGEWYSRQKKGKTICLLGIRADESLNRYRAYANDRKTIMQGNQWTTKMGENWWNAYPIYDWTTKDVWIANGKFDYDYNRIYDLFWKAGLSISQMRVASPYHESAKESLNLYRVLEPATWVRVVSRVQGANFGAIYGSSHALGARKIELPPGHTWRSYVKFLLATLPEAMRRNYIEKFKTSIRFWWKKGGVVDEEAIKELEACNYPIRHNGKSNYKSNKEKIAFLGTPDHTDDIKSTIDIPSWKRMAVCILKNDHLCKYMGFSQTQKQNQRQKELMEKYKKL
jgi:predicted phosphoadenosine phosphosulfate sulfurtransferase